MSLSMVKISAGNYDLNKWLHGGYETDIVNVIYGGAGSGKTNFCLMAAVSQAKKGNKIIYIDSEGGFSVERVKQLFGKVNGDSGQSGKLDLNKALENILLLKPTNFLEQKKEFDKLAKNLKEEASMIIVDSLTIHYRLDLADAREKVNDKFGEIQKINSELARQVGILAEIARKKEISVIVTNQTYNWEDEKKMVGGDILKYWGKCLIELVNEKGHRTAYLRKHRSLAEKSLSFIIYDGGIRKKGWI